MIFTGYIVKSFYDMNKFEHDEYIHDNETVVDNEFEKFELALLNIITREMKYFAVSNNPTGIQYSLERIPNNAIIFVDGINQLSLFQKLLGSCNSIKVKCLESIDFQKYPDSIVPLIPPTFHVLRLKEHVKYSAIYLAKMIEPTELRNCKVYPNNIKICPSLFELCKSAVSDSIKRYEYINDLKLPKLFEDELKYKFIQRKTIPMLRPINFLMASILDNKFLKEYQGIDFINPDMSCALKDMKKQLKNYKRYIFQNRIGKQRLKFRILMTKGIRNFLEGDYLIGNRHFKAIVQSVQGTFKNIDVNLKYLKSIETCTPDGLQGSIHDTSDSKHIVEFFLDIRKCWNQRKIIVCLKYDGTLVVYPTSIICVDYVTPKLFLPKCFDILCNLHHDVDHH